MRFPFEIHNILFLGVVRSTSILYSIPLLELIFMKQTMYYISAFLIAVLLPHVFIMTSTTMVVVLLIMLVKQNAHDCFGAYLFRT